ncbi:hypothetical protein [Streptomyces sp. NPDC003717]|uniref:hypothetical protein n=1 Tax=Streptomyces sp. NPDC003717 TaxID=3154276 RepID=UPI0033A421B9
MMTSRRWGRSRSRLLFGSRPPVHLDQLHLYHQAFGRTTHDHGGERIEAELRIRPGDEIAEMSVRIPAHVTDRIAPEAPVLLLSAPRGHTEGPVEITGLTAESGPEHLAGGRTATHAVIKAPAGDLHGGTPWVFSFRAWELVSPPQGTAPYVHATARLRLRFPATAQLPLLLTVVTPGDVSPRSTQGDFAMAYPSRLLGGERHTNIYFPAAGDAGLSYRCGYSGQLAGSPWVSVGRAAFNSLFVFFIGLLAASVDRGDRFGALLAIFIAAASALWEIVREVSRFTIYGRGRGHLHRLVLVAQLVSLAVLTFSVVGIGLSDSDRLLRHASYLALVVSTVLALIACAGFVLHHQGFWQGFQCDHTGCRTAFRIRRDRPECRYTGRVFCDRHAREVCGGCVHGLDLRTGTIATIGSYRTDRLPCRERPRTPRQRPVST